MGREIGAEQIAFSSPGIESNQFRSIRQRLAASRQRRNYPNSDSNSNGICANTSKYVKYLHANAQPMSVHFADIERDAQIQSHIRHRVAASCQSRT